MAFDENRLEAEVGATKGSGVSRRPRAQQTLILLPIYRALRLYFQHHAPGQDVKILEEELEKLKDPFNKEGISQVETEKISQIQNLSIFF